MGGEEKKFAVSFRVSCKDLRCRPDADKCGACLECIIGHCIRKFDDFKASRITTANHSRQFGVSFMATCKKPDCSANLPRAIACCTAGPDKCEMCLSTIVGRSIRQMDAFHVKEIVVV